MLDVALEQTNLSEAELADILRGADGTFVEQTGFRVHCGGEDQPVDPLIAAAEGPDLRR